MGNDASTDDLALARHPSSKSRRTREMTTPRLGTLARRRANVAGATMLVATGEIHGYLFLAQGYHAVPIIGPLFAVQAVAALALGLVLVGPARRSLRLAGAALAASSAGGFLLSDAVGLFGFDDTFAAPRAVLALVVEVLAGSLLAL